MAVGLDSVGAIAATYNLLEEPFRSLDGSHNGTAVLARLHSVVEFFVDDRLVSACVFLAVVSDLAHRPSSAKILTKSYPLLSHHLLIPVSCASNECPWTWSRLETRMYPKALLPLVGFKMLPPCASERHARPLPRPYTGVRRLAGRLQIRRPYRIYALLEATYQVAGVVSLYRAVMHHSYALAAARWKVVLARKGKVPGQT